MIRTNIYLPKDLHEKLRHTAKNEETSVAQLVRGFVENGLASKEKKTSGAEVLLAMAKRAKPSRIRNLAKRHDYYLYGEGRID